MTDYVSWADLKTVIIGLSTGVVAFFICVAIQRYWSNRSIKSLRRRIQQAEGQKLLVEDLAKSERAVLLFGFQTVFGLFFAMAIISAASQLVLVSIVGGRDLDVIIVTLLWGLPAIISFYAAHLIKKVHDYPASLEIFEKKITKLKNKLLGRE
jgi:sterol desaturase/sphingolipid hydroxylase (fatty acid hydroxylase superfamily)